MFIGNDVVLYDVKTWVDRLLLAQRAVDESKPRDCIRIKPSSLRELARKRPEFPKPSVLPASHAAAGEAEKRDCDRRSQREAEGDAPPSSIPAIASKNACESLVTLLSTSHCGHALTVSLQSGIRAP